MQDCFHRISRSDVITQNRGNIIEKSATCCCGCGFLGRFPVSYLYRISFVGFPHEHSHYHGYNHVFMVVKSLLVEYSTDIPIIMLFNNHSQWLNKIPSFGCEYPGWRWVIWCQVEDFVTSILYFATHCLRELVQNVFQWFSGNLNDFQWFSMVFNGFPLFSGNVFQWFSMFFHGFLVPFSANLRNNWRYRP